MRQDIAGFSVHQILNPELNVLRGEIEMAEDYQFKVQSDIQSDITHKITPMEINSEISNKVTQSIEQRVGKIEDLAANRKDDTWHEVRFEPPFPNGWQVVVLAEQLYYQGQITPGLRLTLVSHGQFSIRWDGPVGKGIEEDGYHQPAAVGWVAYAFPEE